MSTPAFVVVPVSADGSQDGEKGSAAIASAIQQSLHEKTRQQERKEPERQEPEHQEPEQTGPLKQIIAHQDSLYKYISWEDPSRTLGSYVAALSILLGAHYLPLTQTALKAGVATLGVISVTEFASRSFGPNSLSTRLRPKEYKKVPEPTLNATLKDIHDLVQYSVVQAQKIVYGQDLEKTFVAFLGLAALFWLNKVVTPFWLAVIGLTSLYLAPLTTSPRGREVAHDASVRAQELANAAAENGKDLAQSGKAKAAELSSKAQQATLDAGGRIQDLATSGKQAAANASAQARDTISANSRAAADTARKLPETAANASAQARDNISANSRAAADTVRDLPQTGANAVNQAPGKVNSAIGSAKQSAADSFPSTVNGGSDSIRSGTARASDKVSQISNSATEGVKQRAPDGLFDQSNQAANKAWQSSGNSTDSGRYSTYDNRTVDPASSHLASTVSPPGGQQGLYETGPVTSPVSKYGAVGDTAGSHGVINRPRGASLLSPDGV